MFIFGADAESFLSSEIFSEDKIKLKWNSPNNATFIIDLKTQIYWSKLKDEMAEMPNSAPPL